MKISTNPSSLLESRGISHWFGQKRVLHDVNVQIRRGEFLSLVGPSGCGKSTYFKTIVGTHLPRAGENRLFDNPAKPEGEIVVGPGRDRGIVYQHYSLFPFLTAQENVAIGLTLDGTSMGHRFLRPFDFLKCRREHMDRAGEMLRRVRLGDALHLYPHEMSGGMKQRVALAQSMIMQPALILLDEPFGALDESTREELQRMLIDLHSENQSAMRRGEPPSLTLIIVTHELNEALYVGDRVVGLSQYWDWKSEGHERCPGATIVYDKPAPVFEVRDSRDFEQFKTQREEIRDVVFEPKTPTRRGVHVGSQNGS